MSVIGHTISATAPISISDISTVLGVSSCDLGSLCKHENVNKWAKYKPVIHRNVGELTKDELRSTNMGLVPSRNTLAETSADKNINQISGGWEAIVNGSTEWTYNKPTGGATSPYRIADFRGYVHNTQPPVVGFQTWKFYASVLETTYNAARPSSRQPDATSFGEYDGNNLSIVIGEESAYYYSFLGIRWGEASNENVNHPDTNCIPITWLLGGVKTDRYRLVIGVKVSDSLPMMFFSSRATLKDSIRYTGSKPQLIFPSLNTNQYACYRMFEACGFTGTNQPISKTFKAVAFFAKDMMMSGVSRNIATTSSDNSWSNCLVTSESKMYGMPTPAIDFEIEILNDKGYTAGQIGAIRHFSVFADGTGDFAYIGGNATYNRIPVMNLYIRLDEPLNATLSYEITYSYVTGVNGSVPVSSQTTISGTWTVKSSDEAGTKRNLIGGPGISILSKTLTINS